MFCPVRSCKSKEQYWLKSDVSQLWQQFLFSVPGKQKGNCPTKQITQGLLASILFICSHFYRNKKMQSSNNVSQCLPKNKHSSLTLEHGHLLDLWLSQPLKDHCKEKIGFFFPHRKEAYPIPVYSRPHIPALLFQDRKKKWVSAIIFKKNQRLLQSGYITRHV